MKRSALAGKGVAVSEQRIEALALAVPGSFDAAGCFEAVAAVLYARLPYAEVEHVGSTSVPECLTKGDVDLLVRVSVADFAQAQTALDRLLARSPRNEPTDSYTEYDYSNEGFSASVQLVTAGGFHDCHFHGLKAVLKSDPEALQLYNELKLRCDGGSMEDYRDAKEGLIESLLTRRVFDGDVVLRPGIYR